MLARQLQSTARGVARQMEVHSVLLRGLATSTGPLLVASEEQRRHRWGWILLFPVAFTGFLGSWQVSRYQWKVDLLQHRAKGLGAAPVNIHELPQAPAEYSRVAVQGTFKHGSSLYIGPRPRTVMGTANAGYTLVTPLVASNSDRAVLVNRGWVPAQWRVDPGLRNLNSPTEEMEVVGVVRKSEARSGFVPDNNPQKGEWYWIDTPEMAAACGLPPETPLIEVYSDNNPAEQRASAPTTMEALAFKARQPSGTSLYPITKSASDLLDTSVTPTDHRNYALTWFSLSGATAVLAYRALRTPLRRSR